METERFKLVKILFTVLNAVCLFLLILFTSIQITAFNSGFFEKEYKKYEVSQTIKIEMPELIKVTNHMIDYLKNKNDDLNIQTTVNGVQRFFFNEKEISHMDDVKKLFVSGFNIRNISLYIFLISAAFLIGIKAKLKNIQKVYKIAFIAILALIIILGVVIFTDFTKYFNLFHEMFFSNDLWVLNPDTDLLINIVPEGFFMDTVVRIIVTFFISMAAVIAASFVKFKR